MSPPLHPNLERATWEFFYIHGKQGMGVLDNSNKEYYLAFTL